MLITSLSFVPVKPFQPSLMFVSKIRSLPWFGLFAEASLGLASALLANIRLGWLGLLGTNTPAYYEYLSITTVKSFETCVFTPA
jgi:hypothetical protein